MPPVKSKQTSLLQCFGFSGEKQAKRASNGQDASHIKLRKSLSGKSLSDFEEALEKTRQLEDLTKQQLVLKKVAREGSSAIVDPLLRGRGVSRGIKKGGRPLGSKRAHTKHKRGLGEPILRRDPTASEKLTMIVWCEAKLREEGREELKQLSVDSKKQFEQVYLYPFEQVKRWHAQKAELANFIATSRVGKHGLRPCGLRGKNIFNKLSRGSRFTKDCNRGA